MLGNGMMGDGIIIDSVVFFGLFVWAGFLTLSLFTAYWMIETVRGVKEKYNLLREPVAYEAGGVINLGAVGGRIRGKESKKKERAA